MSSIKFINCYNNKSIILTEGAIGLRVSNEFGIIPDRQIKNASLIYDSTGRKTLETIYSQYLKTACDYSLPIILMTNTRRANKETIYNSSYKDKNVMRDYADFLRGIIQKYPCEAYIGGIMGCKGDAYTGEGQLSRQEATDFHSWQIEAFKQSNIDFIFAAIMPSMNEILGMAEAIEQSDFPYIISLMVKENGTIIDGHTIHDVIKAVDEETSRNPLCYMTNCVHPNVLHKALDINNTSLVRKRFKGIQANAACMSPEELDCASETKSSDAIKLANDIISLHRDYQLKIYGGCCGTDDSHIREIAKQLCTK